MNVNLKLSRRAIRFLIAGLFSAGLEIALLIAFVETYDVPLLYANGVAFLIVNVINYILSRYWVFNNRTRRKRVQFAMFMFFVTCGLILNQIVLWVLADNLSLDYRLSKVAAIGAVVVWNFFTRNNVIFNEESRPDAP